MDILKNKLSRRGNVESIRKSALSGGWQHANINIWRGLICPIVDININSNGPGTRTSGREAIHISKLWTEFERHLGRAEEESPI